MSADTRRAGRRFGAALVLAAALLPTDARADGILRLHVLDAPNAEIFVDGARRGTVPPIDDFNVQLILPPGPHRIELRRSRGNPFYDMRASLEVSVRDEIVTSASLPRLVPVPSAGSAERVSATVAALLRDLVTIPAGRFQMGSPDAPEASDAELPRREVTVERPFLLLKTEVTFDQWDACVADRGCTTVPDDQGWNRGTNPVVNVSWGEAGEFTAWLSRVTGRRFRLPSEAEWEYAARGGRDTNYFFGDDPGELRRYAWFEGDRPKPVAQREANPFGLYDMAGNVGEWVEDCWHANFSGAPKGLQAWTESNCRIAVVKGGDYDDHEWYLRPAQRFGHMRRNRYSYVGFRVATDPP
jgi:formylglycine-generating enzyme required for sulfatase activity